MHHPGDIVTTRAVSAGEISTTSITWILIFIGVGVVGFIIYYFVKLKKK